MEEKATMKESEKEDNHKIIQNGNKTVTYDFSSIFCGNDKKASWLHIPAVPFNVSTDATFPYVLNTNGAGDAFCAGFIRGILDNKNIENHSEYARYLQLSSQKNETAVADRLGDIYDTR